MAVYRIHFKHSLHLCDRVDVIDPFCRRDGPLDQPAGFAVASFFVSAPDGTAPAVGVAAYRVAGGARPKVLFPDVMRHLPVQGCLICICLSG
jgi:hypothetical protein